MFSIHHQACPLGIWRGECKAMILNDIMRWEIPILDSVMLLYNKILNQNDVLSDYSRWMLSSLFSRAIMAFTSWSNWFFIKSTSPLRAICIFSNGPMILQYLFQVQYECWEISYGLWTKGWMSFFCFLMIMQACWWNENAWMFLYFGMKRKFNASIVRILDNMSITKTTYFGGLPIVDISMLSTHKPLTRLVIRFWIRYTKSWTLIISTSYNGLVLLWWEWWKVYSG